MTAAARPRWRVSQTILNRAGQHPFTTKEGCHGHIEEVNAGPGRGDKRKHQAKLKPQDCTLGLEVMNPKAAGIDIGYEEHWVAVPPAMDGNPVLCFKCFTADLKAMANWLKECGIETVAMQR